MSEAPIKRTEQEWDAFFYAMAVKVSELSKDPDRKVGALVVSPDRRQFSLGYNGFPPEIPDLPSLLADKAFKLTNMKHAERNCLEQSPFKVEGCSLYVTRFPCFECAQEVVKHGVYRVVAPKPDMNHPRWGRSWWLARQLFWNEGLELIFI